jgi:hypothetical protein
MSSRLSPATTPRPDVRVGGSPFRRSTCALATLDPVQPAPRAHHDRARLDPSLPERARFSAARTRSVRGAPIPDHDQPAPAPLLHRRAGYGASPHLCRHRSTRRPAPRLATFRPRTSPGGTPLPLEPDIESPAHLHHHDDHEPSWATGATRGQPVARAPRTLPAHCPCAPPPAVGPGDVEYRIRTRERPPSERPRHPTRVSRETSLRESHVGAAEQSIRREAEHKADR